MTSPDQGELAGTSAQPAGRVRYPVQGIPALRNPLRWQRELCNDSLRNPDFAILQPQVQLAASPGAVAEIFAAQDMTRMFRRRNSQKPPTGCPGGLGHR